LLFIGTQVYLTLVANNEVPIIMVSVWP